MATYFPNITVMKVMDIINFNEVLKFQRPKLALIIDWHFFYLSFIFLPCAMLLKEDLASWS